MDNHLATMGVGPGCYLVLPVLGPSTVRDTTASVANFIGGNAWYNVTVANDTQHFSDFDYYASRVTSGIDFRAKNFDAIKNLEKNQLISMLQLKVYICRIDNKKF